MAISSSAGNLIGLFGAAGDLGNPERLPTRWSTRQCLTRAMSFRPQPALAGFRRHVHDPNATNGFKTSCAVTQLNCALALLPERWSNAAGPRRTVQSFDGAEVRPRRGRLGNCSSTYPEDIEVLGASASTRPLGAGAFRATSPIATTRRSRSTATRSPSRRLVNGCVFSQFYAAGRQRRERPGHQGRHRLLHRRAAVGKRWLTA